MSEQGVGYEFFYIIAAVVGGCLLTGGYGSAIGAALGACIIGMAFEGVIYAGWDSSWDFAFLGVILFLAVVVNTADLPAGSEGAAMSEGVSNMNDVDGDARRSRCARSPSTSGASTRSRTSAWPYTPGEVTCVLGDNGAGKSTLIKILSGVYSPDQGEMLFEGEPVTFVGSPRGAEPEGSRPCSRTSPRSR